jgi:hypothetical protein
MIVPTATSPTDARNSLVCMVAFSDTCNRHSRFGNHLSGKPVFRPGDANTFVNTGHQNEGCDAILPVVFHYRDPSCSDLSQKPGTSICFIDPVFEQACCSDVAELVADEACGSEIVGQHPVVCQKLCEHGLGSLLGAMNCETCSRLVTTPSGRGKLE